MDLCACVSEYHRDGEGAEQLPNCSWALDALHFFFFSFLGAGTLGFSVREKKASASARRDVVAEAWGVPSDKLIATRLLARKKEDELNRLDF